MQIDFNGRNVVEILFDGIVCFDDEIFFRRAVNTVTGDIKNKFAGL